MTEKHISSADHDRYMARMLESSELLAFSDHLEVCPDCRQRVVAEHSARAAAFAAAATTEPLEHLDYGTMERFVDGRSDDIERAYAGEHIALCARCADDLNDLRAFAGHPVRRPALLAARPWLWAVAASILLLAGGVLFNETFRRSVGTPGRSRGLSRRILVIHDGNGSITLDGAGNVHGAPHDTESLVRETLTTARLFTPPVAADTTSAPPALRGSSNGSSLSLLSPGRAVVLDDAPLFEWKGGGRGATFIVEIFDSDFRPVMRSASLSELHWRPRHALPRGQELQWQVTATAGDRQETAPQPPEPPARFLILDAEAATRIERAKLGRSHLVLATLYARAGMHEEAEGELSALAGLNPASPLVARLRENLRSERAAHGEQHP